MNACEPEPAPGAKLVQGDILKWHRPRTAPPFEELGVIVNADCDLAQNKVGAFLTYVPVLSLPDYADRVWAREKLDQLTTESANNVAVSIHKWHREIIPSARKLTAEEVKEAIQKKTIVAFAKSLIPDDPTEQGKLEDRLKSVAELMDALAESDSTQSLSLYCKLRSKSLGKDYTPEQATKSIIASLCDPKKIGSFFISNITGIREECFVAPLRLFRTVPLFTICQTREDWYRMAEDRDVAIRVARLVPHLKYALVQSFADLFVRIGLPSEYEGRRTELLQKITKLGKDVS